MTNFQRLAAVTSVIVGVVVLFMLFAKSTNIVILPIPKVTAGIPTRPLTIESSKNDSIGRESFSTHIPSMHRLDLTSTMQSTTVTPTAETDNSEQMKSTSISLEGCGAWIDKCKNECVDGEGETIPRTVFFVKVDDNFVFREWLAVMSAVKIIKADSITVFSATPLSGCWWKRTLPFIKHEIVPESGWITKLNGKELKELAHKSDFLRIEALYRLGGIYMDTDAIATKSFEPLLAHNQAVFAKQSGGVAACGVMIARKHSCIMCSYMRDACRSYNGAWARHSIETLMHMQHQGFRPHHGVVLLEQKQGFYPIGWEDPELHKLYDVKMESVPFKLDQAYAIHLWNHVGSSTNYPKKLYDYTWLSQSPSIAARALRRLLPQGFSEKYMDETICLDLPQE